MNFETLLEYEYIQPDLNPACRTRVLYHGQRQERAILLLHGLTACPEQFAVLGQSFYERGYNVLIPRMPCHGMKDRYTLEMNSMRSEDLKQYAKESAEAALEIGKQVSVFGFSTGGLLASWLALEYPEIELAAAAAPIFGLSFIPAFAHPAFPGLLRRLPNFYIWWDPIRRAKSPFASGCGYPGFPIHALANVLRLSQEVYQQALRGKPQPPRVIFILNENEPAVNNRMVRNIVNHWQRHDPNQTQIKTFPRGWHLPHDLISLNCPGGRTDRVYAQIVEWLN